MKFIVQKVRKTAVTNMSALRGLQHQSHSHKPRTFHKHSGNPSRIPMQRVLAGGQPWPASIQNHPEMAAKLLYSSKCEQKSLGWLPTAERYILSARSLQEESVRPQVNWRERWFCVLLTLNLLFAFVNQGTMVQLGEEVDHKQWSLLPYLLRNATLDSTCFQ